MRLIEQAKHAAYRTRLRQRVEVKKLRAQNAPLVSFEYQLAVRELKVRKTPPPSGPLPITLALYGSEMCLPSGHRTIG